MVDAQSILTVISFALSESPQTISRPRLGLSFLCRAIHHFQPTRGHVLKSAANSWAIPFHPLICPAFSATALYSVFLFTLCYYAFFQCSPPAANSSRWVSAVRGQSLSVVAATCSGLPTKAGIMLSVHWLVKNPFGSITASTKVCYAKHPCLGRSDLCSRQLKLRSHLDSSSRLSVFAQQKRWAASKPPGDPKDPGSEK